MATTKYLVMFEDLKEQVQQELADAYGADVEDLVNENMIIAEIIIESESDEEGF